MRRRRLRRWSLHLRHRRRSPSPLRRRRLLRLRRPRQLRANAATEPGEVKDLNVTRRSLLLGAGGAAVSPALAKTYKRNMKDRVAVIGAGVFGAWTAHHLQQQGHAVTLIDAWGPAHSRASSGGESRLTRAAYGKDAIYTRMAADSLPQWKALNAVSGLPILVQAGVLFFFPNEEPYVADSIAAHKALGLPTEVLTRADMKRRFPMIDFDGISVGLYERDFGALMARRSVLTLVERF